MSTPPTLALRFDIKLHPAFKEGVLRCHFQHVKEINRSHNFNSFIAPSAQEIEVFGDNEVGFARYGTGENVVIRRVFWDDGGDNVRCSLRRRI